MIISLLLYFTLLLLMVFTSYISVSIARLPSNEYKPLGTVFYYFPIIIYSLFWGFRYNVGTDFQNYQNLFVQLAIGNFEDFRHIEFGYIVLNRILSSLNFSSTSIFIVTSFIIIWAIQRYTQHEPYLLPLTIFFFFTTTTVFFTQNGIRQSIAWVLFVLSLKYLTSKKFVKYILLIIIAFYFHKSIIIPSIIVIFAQKNIFKNRTITISLLVMSFLFSNLIYKDTLSLSSYFFDILNYTYSNRINNYFIDNKISVGFGVFVKYFIYLFIIFYSSYTKKKSKSKLFLLFYNFFVIGILLEPIVTKNMIFNRINFYFLSMNVFCYAYVAYYLLKSKKNSYKYASIIIILSTILIFIAAVMNNSSDCGIYQLNTN